MMYNIVNHHLLPRTNLVLRKPAKKNQSKQTKPVLVFVSLNHETQYIQPYETQTSEETIVTFITNLDALCWWQFVPWLLGLFLCENI